MAQYLYCGSEIVWNGYGDLEAKALLRLPVEFEIGRLGSSDRMNDRITVTRSDAPRLEQVLAEARFEEMVNRKIDKSRDFDLLYMMSAILFYMNQHPDQDAFELSGEAF